MDPSFDLAVWKYLYLMSKGKTLDGISRENNLSLASLLRKIRALEERLGTPLLTNTKPLRLTEDAVKCIPEIEKLNQSHKELLNCFNNGQIKPKCIQFAVAPGSLSAGEVNLVLMEFSKLYPAIEFQVEVGPKIQEIVEGSWEISTFTGELNSPDLEKLSRGNATYIPVASPLYIKRFG